MNIKIYGIVLVLGLGLLASSVFIVDERQKAIKFRLGEIVQSDYKPGIYFQTPFVNNVKTFDARIQTLDARPARIITKEKKYVLVDSFVKWRIGDVEKYYTTMGGDTRQANSKLAPIANKYVRDQFGSRSLKGVVSGDREAVMNIVKGLIKDEAVNYGIEIVDVRVKRVDFETDISENVFARMRTERDRVAKERRAGGAADGEQIRAGADKDYTTTLADAYRQAQITRGEGDATAAETYANAYGKDKEFYSFYRSLNAYKQAFSSKSDVILLEPDAEFFKYFKDPTGKK